MIRAFNFDSHMITNYFSHPTARALIPLIGGACFIFLAASRSIHAQSALEEQIVVTGEEVPSAYGAPPGLSRSRFSNTVNAYVLPPWSFFFGELFEGAGSATGHPIIFSLKRWKWVCPIVLM